MSFHILMMVVVLGPTEAFRDTCASLIGWDGRHGIAPRLESELLLFDDHVFSLEVNVEKLPTLDHFDAVAEVFEHQIIQPLRIGSNRCEYFEDPLLWRQKLIIYQLVHDVLVVIVVVVIVISLLAVNVFVVAVGLVLSPKSFAFQAGIAQMDFEDASQDLEQQNEEVLVDSLGDLY